MSWLQTDQTAESSPSLVDLRTERAIFDRTSGRYNGRFPFARMVDESCQSMATNAAQADALRWKKFSVLDDGFVCLVDVMGDDQSVVQAARVSYGEGTRKVSDDRGLIRYLMRHRHSTPFEMAEAKFLVRVPMDCWRQWIRHRTANVNEYSTRYSLAIDAAQATPPDQWRTQAATNRQGSGEALDPAIGERLTAAERDFQSRARELYEERINAGVAREQARKDLPLSTYTESYWKIDLHNLLHFLALRMDSHAQYEIRSYATTIGEQIIQPLFPLVWEAFVDYRLEAMSLSRQERELIVRLAQRLRETGRAAAAEDDFLAVQDPTWRDLTRCRERDECREKMILLGLLSE
jgi:thymidylate synthase (FAD)